MINKFIKKCSWCNVDAALLVIRICVGLVFIFSGWMKVSNMTMTLGFFAGMGFSAFWAYLASYSELIFGLAVLIGVYTRFAAMVLGIIMVVAISIVYKDMAMVMTPIAMLFMNISLILGGGGRFSLMRKICGCGDCAMCKDSDVEAAKV